MRSYIIVFLYLCSALYGREPSLKNEPVCLITEALPNSFVNNSVNTIDGSFYYEMHHITVPGHAPLNLIQYYNNKGSFSSWIGTGMSLNYSFWMQGSDDSGKSHDVHDKYEALVTEAPGGSIIRCLGKSKPDGTTTHYYLDPDVIHSGLTNCGSGKLSARTNLKNTLLRARRYSNGTIKWTCRLANGTEREYHKSDDFEENKNVKWEQRPDGTRLDFHYNNHRIKEIKTKWAELHFDKEKHLATVSASNNKRATFRYFTKDGRRYIDEIQSTDNPEMEFHYTHAGSHYCIDKISWPHGRFLEIEYDHKARVVCQKAPVGKDGEKRTIFSFSYGDHTTEVHDANSNKSSYHYKNKRLTAIKQYKRNHTLSRIKAYTWGESSGLSWAKHPKSLEGNLLSESVLDQDEKAQYVRRFSYDEYGNVLTETLCGNLSGTGKATEHYHRRYTYSHNHLHLKLTESEDSGPSIVYRYKKGTDLIWAKYTLDRDKIILREFYSYDDDGIMVEKIVDDGSTRNKVSLRDVTERHITTIVPEKSHGLPESITECFLDLSTEKQVLIKRTEYSYNEQGQVTKEGVIDAQGQRRYTITTVYDHKGRIHKKNNELNEWSSYGYDDNGNKTYEKKYDTGLYTKFEYDKANRLTAVVEHHDDGTVVTKGFEHDLMGNVVATIDRYGHKTHYEYDHCNRVRKITFPDKSTVTRKYDLFDNMIKEVNQNGAETRFEYTIRNKPSRIVYADGSSERFEYNLNGTLKYKWDKSGTKTSYSYDILGRITKTEVDNAITVHRYNSFHLLSTTDPMGYTTHFRYDGQGRKVEEQQDTSKTTFEYDALGRPCCTKAHIDDKEYIATHTERDLLDRVTLEKKVDTNNQVISWAYYHFDVAGNCTLRRTGYLEGQDSDVRTTYNSEREPIACTDELGFVTSYHSDHTGKTLCKKSIDPHNICTFEHYDVCNRLVSSIKKNGDQLLSQTDFVYSPTGKKTAQIDKVLLNGQIEREHTIRWEYDLLDRITKVIQEDTTTSYTYDMAGRISTITKPDGIVLSHSYDALGRLVRLVSSDQSVSYSYTYDLHNNPLQITDEVSKRTLVRTYDAKDRPLSDGIQNVLNQSFTYDPIGRLTCYTAPDDSSVTYTYEKAHLSTIRRGSYEHRYHLRNLQEQVLESTLITGSQLTLEWDKKGRNSKSRSSHYCHEAYFDEVGNLRRAEVDDPLGHLQIEATYDSLNQITSESGVQQHLYQNDSIANRRARDDKPYTIDCKNRLLSDSQEEFTYDQNGNLLASKDSTYTYDALDRLIKVVSNNTVTTYQYDSFHRRIARSINGKAFEYFLYLDKREIGLYAPETGLKEFRVLGLGRGAELGATVLIELGNKTFCPLHDYRGNIVCLVDTLNQPQQTYRYTAFGECEVSDSRIENPWRFAGKRFDVETGFVYFSRRYYAPTTGRWVTPDPLGFADGPNLYAYVQNNPFSKFDLYGLSVEEKEETKRDASTSNEYKIPFLKDLFSRSGWRNVGNKKIEGVDVVVVNGMSNSENAATENFKTISDMGGGIEVKGLYNATNRKWDLFEAAAQMYTDLVSITSELYIKYIKDFHRTQPADAKCLTFCHSQGTVIVRNALQKCSPEEQQRAMVVAVAPSAIVSDKICFQADNYISTADPIGRYCDRAGIRDNPDNVHFLAPHKSASKIFDHGFASPTYKNDIEKHLKDYIKDYGKGVR